MENQEVGDDAPSACTTACTSETKTGHGPGIGGAVESTLDRATGGGTESTEAPADPPIGEHFAEAIAMLARLPLSDAERAEAVRRMMAERRGE